MKADIFIPAKEAMARYGKQDLRTLKAWAKAGYLLYQVIGEKSKNPRWMFESPEARYERLLGSNK